MSADVPTSRVRINIPSRVQAVGERSWYEVNTTLTHGSYCPTAQAYAELNAVPTGLPPAIIIHIWADFAAMFAGVLTGTNDVSHAAAQPMLADLPVLKRPCLTSKLVHALLMCRLLRT